MENTLARHQADAEREIKSHVEKIGSLEQSHAELKENHASEIEKMKGVLSENASNIDS